MCVCSCAASSAATPPDAVPTTEAGAGGSPAVPAEASALTDEQGAVLDGNEIKKACLSSEEKSSEEKRGGKVESAGHDWERECGVKEGSFRNSVDVSILSFLPGISQIRTFLKVYGAELRLLLKKNNP